MSNETEELPNSDLKFVDITTHDITSDGTITVSTLVALSQIETNDIMIKLAKGNTADILDTGWYSEYNDGAAKYRGCAYDASASKFVFFNSTTDPSATIGSGYTLLDVTVKDLVSTNITGTLSTAAQPNITSVGTLTSLALAGAISGVTTLTATTLAGTLSTAAQPNITSVGTLASLALAGAISASNGSVSAPSYSFANSTGSGMYYTGTANTIALATNGTSRLTLNTASITSTLPYLGSAGSVSAPSLSFSGDPDTGLYNSTTDTIALATNGVARITTNTASITTTLPFVATGGSYSTPTYGFGANLGIYSPAANAVEIASSNVGNGSDVYLARFSKTGGWAQVRSDPLTRPDYFINQQYYGGNLIGPYHMAAIGDASSSIATAWNYLYCWNLNGAAFRIQGNGAVFADGAYNSSGADYAEYFESGDGKEIPVGSTVVLVDGKIRKSLVTDDLKTIIGVVRPKNTSDVVTIGNTYEDYWSGKFEKDEFGSYVIEPFTNYNWDQDGKTVSYHSDRIPNGIVVPDNKRTVDSQRMKWSVGFDPNAAYVPRSQRPEWLVIGLLGQIPVRNNEYINSNWILIGNIGDGTVAKRYLVR